MDTDMDKLWSEMEELCLEKAKKLLEDIDLRTGNPTTENVEMADKLVYMATTAVMTRQRRRSDTSTKN